MPTNLLQSVLSKFIPRFLPRGEIQWMRQLCPKPSEFVEPVRWISIVDSLCRVGLPEIIVFEKWRNQLTLIDLVTIQGTMTKSRQESLKCAFEVANVRLEFVMAFQRRSDLQAVMSEYSGKRIAGLRTSRTT